MFKLWHMCAIGEISIFVSKQNLDDVESLPSPHQKKPMSFIPELTVPLGDSI